MKALKFFRLLSMAAGLLCFLISCLPQGEDGYDWAMITVLVLFLVIGPTSLIANIKRENHPQTLAEYNTGYLVISTVLMAIVFGLCVTGIILGLGSFWMNLAFTFATIYNLLNHIILYKAKKTSSANLQ